MVATAKVPRGWCAELRRLGVVRVAEAFGGRMMDESKPREGLTPCPVCGDATRHTKTRDKRGAVGIAFDKSGHDCGWHCFQCDTKGTPVDWAAYAVTGRDEATSKVRAACERAGLLGGAASGLRPRQRLKVVPAPYLTPNEARTIFGRACVVTDETQAAAWLARQRLDPHMVADLGVVMALPESAAVPPWAHYKGRPWPEAGYRLIAPLVDAEGQLRGAHARRTAETDTPKTLSPWGHAVAGLVMANPRARRWLAGQEKPTRIVIAEGLKDWLVKLCIEHTRGTGAAMVGIVAGSWTQAHADKVPDGCCVVIATDPDEAGEKYAHDIRKTLNPRARRGRVAVKRWESLE